MCYTASDSLIGYIIGSLSSLYLIRLSNSQYNVLGYFFLFVSQMQLFDFVFWNNPSCSTTNYLTTKVAIIANHLQPIILLLLQYIYGFNLSSFSLVVGFLYSVSTIFYTIHALQKVECTYIKNNIVSWQWNELPTNTIVYGLFLLSYFASSLNFEQVWMKWLTMLVTLTSFVIAQKTPILNQSVGRIWCYYAAFVPAIYAMIYSIST